MIFKQPVLAVGQLGSGSEKQLLSHVRIAPAIAGSFIALTPRMIGFQSDSALPPATRVRVTLTAGLADLDGNVLRRDVAWTFTTPPLEIALPRDYQTPGPGIGLRPVIPLTANAEIDPDGLARAARFSADDGSGSAGVNVSPAPHESGAPQWIYTVSPQRDLQKAKSYRLIVDAGVMPVGGNLPGTAGLQLPLTTYSALQFVGAIPTADPLSSTGSRFAGGDPALRFSNPLDAKSYARHIAIAPSPSPVGRLFSLSDDGSAVLVNPQALAPGAAYTFTIDSRMQDAYGQQLGSAVRTRYVTGRLTPYFWAPSGNNTFVPEQGLQIQYSAVNLPANRYRAAYRVITPAELAGLRSGYPPDMLPSPALWNAVSVPGARRDRQAAIDVPLRKKLGADTGMLAYGASGGGANQGAFTGSVLLTNLGIFAQWFPRGGFVMVQRLSDGAPVSSAGVAVYIPRDYQQTAAARLCASGTTNDAGVLQIAGAAIESCYAGNRPASEAPHLFVVARSGADWSYANTYDWSGVYQYSSAYFDASWSNGQPISRGVVFSDRQMYQPGERGWFTAECYVLQNGVLRADRNARYAVSLRDPDGNVTNLPSRMTNRFATFSLPIDFSKTQRLGSYTLLAKSPDGAEITGSFRVAQFRPPNFSVNLALNRPTAAAGERVGAAGSAQYLFGAPMSGARATIHVTREQTSIAPKGWEDFTFGRQWFWPEEPPDVSAQAGEQDLTLDGSGKVSTQVAVARDLPYAMTYRVDLEVTDASNLASSATQSFTALPASKEIGLRSDFVAAADAPVALAVIVTDAQGKTQPGTRVHVELQKMEYSGVTQIVEGAEAARNQVRYTTVSQADVTSANAPQNVALRAKDSGNYRIRANFAGSSNDATATDSQVWINGPGRAAWGDQNPSQLQLKLDKSTYAAGDTAVLAVASPYQKADLYLSVVRDRVLYRRLVHLQGAAPKISLPVTDSMFPNAAVEAVLVRRGVPLSHANAQGVQSLVRIGMLPIALDLRSTRLTASAVPLQAKLLPGGRQRVRLQLRDRGGKPVAGQFTVIVANDAILQLSGYRPPDLAQTVFQAQPISTRFADNRPDVTLAQPADTSEKGWGYGGGFLAGAAGTRVRTHFVPLAYFNGSVQTGVQGTAEIAFDAPDNLTTWRVMAVASTAETRPRFASADATFVTSKPLVTDPLLPQFARPGDRFDGGELLMNAAGKPADARTQALLSGALTFATPAGSQQTQARQTFAAGMNAWRFPIVAGSAGPAWLEMRTTLAGGQSDAFRVPFPVRSQDVTESTMEAGATRDSAQIPLAVTNPGATVQVEIAGSLLPAAIPAAAQVLSGESLPLLSTAASRLSAAVSIRALEARLTAPAGSPNARSAANAAVSQLQALQRIDGGFAFWPDAGSSDAFGSAQALEALAYAKSAGVSMPAALPAKAKAYAVRALADPASAAKWCKTDRCKAVLRLALLQALAQSGDRRTDFLQSIYAVREGLGVAERVNLEIYLQRAPGWTSQANALFAQLNRDVYQTGRYANVQPDGVWWAGSAVAAQAAYVRALLARGSPEASIDRAVQALIAQRCKCGWPGVQDGAAALRALAGYSAAHHSPPDFSAQVLVDGKLQAALAVRGFTAPKTIVLTALSAGAHTIQLKKKGSGTLHYAVTYRYHLGSDAPGRLAGLRVVREIRAVNAQRILQTMDIQAPAQPFSLPAASVYDVGVKIMVDHPVDRVVIEDPLPAGLEAIDTSFQTNAAYYQPLADAWQIDYQQIYSDRISAFAQHLDPGVYELHYLARTVTPGSYLWPGATAKLLNAPEEFGRSSASIIRVGP